MKVPIFLARARSALGKKTVYKSQCGIPSFAVTDWPKGAKADCSGFVNWCLQFSQSAKVDNPVYKNTNGGWFETTAIHADGNDNTEGYFSRIDIPKPGVLLVYPDYVGSDQKKHQGHIGIVIETSGQPGIKAVTKVIHCSEAQWQQKGDAIQITNPDKWLAHENSIII